MGQKAVIAHPDTPASRYPPDGDGHSEIRPAKIEQGPYGKDMTGRNKEDGIPVDLG